MKEEEEIEISEKYFAIVNSEIYQKMIPLPILKAIFEIIRKFRNRCVHTGHFFCFKSTSTIRATWIHKKLKLPKDNLGKSIFGIGDMLSVLISIKLICSQQKLLKLIEEINAEIINVVAETKIITEDEILLEMGLPSDWLKSGYKKFIDLVP